MRSMTADHVQPNAARLVLKKGKRNHVTSLLKELHWLPVKFRYQYKIATLAYRHFEGLHLSALMNHLALSDLLMKSC